MGTIRDTVSDLARERGEFPQFSPEVDLAPLADATETAIGVAVAAVAFDAEDIGYDNTDSELTANNAQAAIDEVVVRVEALEDVDPPAPSSGEFDVTVTTALVAGDVGKVVVLGNPATIYQGGATPAGVLVSVDGLGGGVVRRWGEATCQFGLGLPSVDSLLKADPATAKVVAAEPGSFAVFGRVLSYDGSGTGTVFITAISTYGMRAAG